MFIVHRVELLETTLVGLPIVLKCNERVLYADDCCGFSCSVLLLKLIVLIFHVQ